MNQTMNQTVKKFKYGNCDIYVNGAPDAYLIMSRSEPSHNICDECSSTDIMNFNEQIISFNINSSQRSFFEDIGTVFIHVVSMVDDSENPSINFEINRSMITLNFSIDKQPGTMIINKIDNNIMVEFIDLTSKNRIVKSMNFNDMQDMALNTPFEFLESFLSIKSENIIYPN